MLKNLRIENFRCFKSFELKELGQLNLLVGKNNSGKTSILEAIQLLVSESPLEALREALLNRNEYVLSEERSGIRELDICHLFNGHEFNVGSKVFIHTNSNNEMGMTISVDDNTQQMQLKLFDYPNDLYLVIDRTINEEETIRLPMTMQGGLHLDLFRRLRREYRDSGLKTQLITSSSLTTEKMIKLFDQIVLMPEEGLVIEALQTVEPNIERIAPVNSDKYRTSDTRSGYLVKLSGCSQRIPIGSMGEGIWRMLGLALALVNARDGVLLVDDIDTGLHFTTMSDMWKLVWETAKRLNVQVFATTHSSDCWKSLDAIASEENPSKEGITIHRIEKGKSKSVVFTEQQVVIAAEDGIEVR